jgi:hypothetical protein
MDMARATLEDPNATTEQKEIAQEVIKVYTADPPRKRKKASK